MDADFESSSIFQETPESSVVASQDESNPAATTADVYFSENTTPKTKQKNVPKEKSFDFIRSARSKNPSRILRKRFELGLPIKFNDDNLASPFPWTYQGIYIGNAVWITNKHEKSFLYLQGFFGKGILSKAEAQYDQLTRQTASRKMAVSSSERQLQRKLNREKMKLKRKQRRVEEDQSQQQTKKPAVNDGQDDSQVDAVSDNEEYEKEGQEHEEAEDTGGSEMQGTLDATSSPSQLKRKITRRKFEKVDEHLQIGLEEAFFLVYAIGCLRVKHEHTDTIPLTIAQCWQSFCHAVPGFPSAYAAYHFLRSKGWVPKSGLKFGVDWIIYKNGPVFFHSDFSVVVLPTYENESTVELPKFIGASPHMPLNWPLLSNLNRVSGQVVKDILLLQVLVPNDVTESDCSTPEIIRRFSVYEMPLRRWMPEKDR